MKRIRAIALSFIVAIVMLATVFSISHAQSSLINGEFDENPAGDWSCIRSNWAVGTWGTNCTWTGNHVRTIAESKISKSFFLEAGEYELVASGRAVSQGAGDNYGVCNINSRITVLDVPGAAWQFGTKNYSFHEVGGAFTVTKAITALVRYSGNNSAICNNVSELDYVRITGGGGGGGEEPPIDEPPIGEGGSCLVVSPDGDEYQRPSNLIYNKNPSFEQLNQPSLFLPSFWMWINFLNAPYTIERDPNYPNIPATNAFNGFHYIRVQQQAARNGVYQTLSVPEGKYQIGGYINNNKSLEGSDWYWTFGVGVMDQGTVSPTVEITRNTVTDGWAAVAHTVAVSNSENVYFFSWEPSAISSQRMWADQFFIRPVKEVAEGEWEVDCDIVQEIENGEGGEGGGGEEPPPPPPPPPGGGQYGWGGGLGCNDCPVPGSLDMLRIGVWISYLACYLGSLFFCALQTWIYNVWNTLNAFYLFVPYAFNTAMFLITSLWGWVSVAWGQAMQFLVTFGLIVANLYEYALLAAEQLFLFIQQPLGIMLLWAAYAVGQLFGFSVTSINATLAWFNNLYGGGLGQFFYVVNTLWGWLANFFLNSFGFLGNLINPWYWINLILDLQIMQLLWSWVSAALGGFDLLAAVGYAVVTMFWQFMAALGEFLEMVWLIIDSIRGAYSSDAYSIVLDTGSGEIDTVDPAQLSASGFNPTKVLWIMFMSLAAADYFVEVFPLELILVPAVGVLCFGVFTWTLNQWQKGLPF